MNCSKMQYCISLYLDQQLDSALSREVEVHLNECPECASYYEYLRSMVQLCRDMDEVDLPPDFHDRLHERLIREERRKMKRVINGKAFVGIVAAIMVVFVGVALLNSVGGLIPFSGKSKLPMADTMDGANYSTSSAPKDQAAEEEVVHDDYLLEQSETKYDTPNGFGGQGVDAGMSGEAIKGDKEVSLTFSEDDSTQAQATSSYQGKAELERKIIKSAYIGVETLEFNRTVDTITGKLSALGGYVESSNVQGVPKQHQGERPANRKAHFELRIPKKHFEQFISDIAEFGNIVTKQINGEDITGQYFDTEARLKSLKIQEERLLTILAKAEKLQDIIELERELSRIRYEIENYTGTLKKWDDMVEYSRISIDVYEVKEIKKIEPKPVTWGEKITRGFNNSLETLVVFIQDTVVFLVSAVPYLVLIGLLGLAVRMVYLKYRTPKGINGNGGADKDE